MATKSSNPATWARLMTPYRQWNRHSDEDDIFCDFLIQSGIRVQSGGLSANPGNLEDLCRHFLIFATDISYLVDPASLANLREYAYRGGFIYIEMCHDRTVTPSLQLYHERQVAALARLFPTGRMGKLSATHPIFDVLFPVPEQAVAVSTDPHGPLVREANAAFYGVYDDDRLIVLLGQMGIRCAWGREPQQTERKMQLSANAIALAYKQAGYE